MPTLPVYNLEKKQVGSIELDDKIFAAEVKPHLVHSAVKQHQAKKYEVKPANSLTRSEVRGSRKKIYRQKGTGQARHGDKKAPIFVGGGKSHGPRPRIVKKRLNKKVMSQALISVLSLMQKEDRLFVVDKLELEKCQTKAIANSMKAFGLNSALILNSQEADTEKFFNLSVKNLRSAKHLKPEGLNVFDALKYKNLIVSQSAVQKVTERLNNA